MTVLKDAQMLGALVAAVGIVTHFRLAERRVPFPAAMIVAVLIAYATLVRANALFSTISLAVLLLPRPASFPAKGALAIVAMGVLLVLTPVMNQRLFRCTPYCQY